ncbi:MAG: ester cyclase [Nitrososphaeraceae archaeon]
MFNKVSRLVNVNLFVTTLTLVLIGGIVTSIVETSAQIDTNQTNSQEEKNKELVLAFFKEVYDNRNVSAIDQYLSEDYSFDIFKEEFSGDRNSIKNDLNEIFNAFPDLNRILKDIIAEGDMVAIFQSWNGTQTGQYLGIQPTGNKFNATTADLFIISNNMILEDRQVADYYDFFKALEFKLDN